MDKEPRAYSCMGQECQISLPRRLTFEPMRREREDERPTAAGTKAEAEPTRAATHRVFAIIFPRRNKIYKAEIFSRKAHRIIVFENLKFAVLDSSRRKEAQKCL
jgi:hypothetical protein